MRKAKVCSDEIALKVNEIVERDARYTVRDIARIVGISLSTMIILKNFLNVRKISARWVPRLLTNGNTWVH